MSEPEAIQVVIAFPELRKSFERWLKKNGLTLFSIPMGTDDLPTYGIKPK